MRERRTSMGSRRSTGGPPSRSRSRGAPSNQAAQDELQQQEPPRALWEHVNTDMVASGPDDARIPYDERGNLRDIRGPRKEDVMVNRFGAGSTEMARSGNARVYEEDSVAMWNVFFDHRSDGQTQDQGTWRPPTRNRDPLILDLNRNGKHDTTAKTTLADGRIDGPTTKFDLDPTRCLLYTSDAADE